MKKIFTILSALILITACGSLELDKIDENGFENDEADNKDASVTDDDDDVTDGQETDADDWNPPDLTAEDDDDDKTDGGDDPIGENIPDEFTIRHEFRAFAGDEMQVSVIALGAEGFVPRLAIYAPDKTLLAKDANSDKDDMARIRFTADEDGVYLALVANRKELPFAEEAYKLQIECLSCEEAKPNVKFCTSSDDCAPEEICTTERKEDPECLMSPECNEDIQNCDNVCYGRCVLGEKRCDCQGVERDPVCGVNGKTYQNECLLNCDGVELDHRGECMWDPTEPMCWEKFCEEGEEIVWCTDDIEEDGCPSLCVCRPANEAGCGSDADCPKGKYCAIKEEDCIYSCWQNEKGEEICEEYCRGICMEKMGDIKTCLSDGDCMPHESCEYPEEIMDECLPPPGCEYGGPCDDVCAGICVPKNEDRICYSTEDCNGGEICTVEMGECLPPPGCDDDWGGGCPDICTGFCVPLENNCGCPGVYAPVCGKDGVTYPNECIAKCNNVLIDYEGECYADSGCEVDCLIPDPVCGVDGVTYWCGYEDARCNGVEVAYEGECENSGGGGNYDDDDDDNDDDDSSSVTNDNLCMGSYDCEPGMVCSLDIGRDDCFSNCDETDGVQCPPICMGECIERNEVDCPDECEEIEWAPKVCNNNGDKYDNACFAFCDGLMPKDWQMCW